MRNENIGTANIKVLEVEQIDVQDGTIEKYVGIDSNGAVVKSTSGGGGGAGLVDGDYGDVVVSGVGTVMTIDDLAVTTAKIADNAVELGKIQEIGQHKLIGRHSAGDGIPHQIGVTNGIEFTGQDIGIADSGVTQAKLDATGAAAGKVLTTDGTAMTWETPAGGGLTLPIDETVGVYSNEAAIALTLSQPSAGYTKYPKGVSLSIENFTGDGTGQGIGLEITGADGSSSGGPCYSLAIKSGDPISTTHILNTEQNYLTIDSSHVRIGGVYEWNEGYAGQSSFAITGSLNIDINNPSIPIGDGSVTETKLADSSVTQAKISATGADVGKVLTTDGTTMTWETPYTAPTGTANNTTRFNASGQLVETNVIAISDAADVIVTGETFDVSLTGGSYIYMDNTSSYLSLQNGDNLDGGGLILSNPGGPNLTYGLDTADSIWTQSVTYLVKLDANTYTGNGSILVGEYDVAEDVPKWGFRNIADYVSVAAHKVGELTLEFAMAHNNGSIRKDVLDEILTNTEINKYIAQTNTTNRQNIFLSLLGANVRPPMAASAATVNSVRSFIAYAGGRLNIFTDGASNGILQTADFVTFTPVESHNYKRAGIPDGFLASAHQATRVPVWTNHLTNEMIASSGFHPVSGSGLMGITYINSANVKIERNYTFHTGGLCYHNTHPVCLNGMLSVYNPQLAGRTYSNDNGVTWWAANNSISTQNVSVLNATTLISNTNGGTTAKYTTDLVTWTSMNLPSTSSSRENCFATNGSIVVYVALNGQVYTIPTLSSSPTWTGRTHNLATGTPNKVFWCGDIFILMSDANDANISTSPDGITWTARTIDAAMVKYAVAKVGTRYVMWGEGRLTSTLNATSTWTTLSTTNMNAVGAVSSTQSFSFYASSFIPTSDSVYFISTGQQITRYIAASNTISVLTASQQLSDVVGIWNNATLGITTSSLATRYLK